MDSDYRAMTTRRQPRFVVLEGLDGAGTTTQTARLAAALQARDLRVHATAEPSDGPLGRVARAHVKGEIDLDPHTAALAFTADRADHLHREIRPALAGGARIVCDRYLLSTLAYQGAEGVDPAWILRISEGFEVPDLTVFLDLPDDQRRVRMADRDHTDRYEAPELDGTLRGSYLAAIELLRTAGHRIVTVDASRPPDDVLADVLAALDGTAPRP